MQQQHGSSYVNKFPWQGTKLTSAYCTNSTVCACLDYDATNCCNDCSNGGVLNRLYHLWFTYTTADSTYITSGSFWRFKANFRQRSCDRLGAKLTLAMFRGTSWQLGLTGSFPLILRCCLTTRLSFCCHFSVELASMVLPHNDAGCHHSLNTLYWAPSVSTRFIDTSCLWHVIHISKLTLAPEPYTGTGP